MQPQIQSKLPNVGTTIFTVMSSLAIQHNAINLGQGFPDYEMSSELTALVSAALQKGYNQYVHMNGLPLLRERLAEKVEFLYQTKLNADTDITITPGGTYAIYTALTTIIQPGDEVIVFEPAYDSYIPNIEINGGVPVLIALTFPTYSIDWELVKQKITTKTKAIIICSPNNPTGMIYSTEELKALAEVLKKQPNIIILSDDIYEHLIWSDLPFANLLMVCPELKDRTIVVNGVSKSYAMTGWRIGYAAGPAEVINQIKNIQMQTTSAPNSIAQMAALAAITGPQDSIPLMNKQFKLRHDFLVKALNALPGVKCVPAQGAFYLLPDFSDWLKQHPEIGNDEQLAETLLTEIHIATVAGTPFGAPNCIRLSFASSMDTLEEAMQRLERFVTRYCSNF